ncbi:hypothetical protein SMKI_04G3240 [Saccharomyces mikatae IFO 1815]|uniref:Spo71p n=1 Tax=Saccharomyces mikatae IFO 1815 TaxID=226126 RepID=A0AA35IYV7_SACMI|nr:uncharacterized protein SMKI_04G3240 [Saccharomyces mikatae IFO 1815]CAI4037987.1 hypothetical protein SMKI_04G3240 [Saccharomyces mikatae IFO 1815]
MDSIVAIVEDDISYAQRVINFSSPQNVNVKVFTIPRHSFTAFRLSYVPPTELSKCSQVTLLGGIPKQWYADQNSQVWKLITKISLRKVRKQSDMLKRYGYGTIYKKRVGKTPSASYLRKHFTWQYEDKTSIYNSRYLKDSEAQIERTKSSPVQSSKRKINLPKRCRSSSIQSFVQRNASEERNAGPSNKYNPPLDDAVKSTVIKSTSHKELYDKINERIGQASLNPNRKNEQQIESLSREDHPRFDRIPSGSSIRKVKGTDFNFIRRPSEDTLRHSPGSIVGDMNLANLGTTRSFPNGSQQYRHSNDLSDGFSTSNTIDNLPLNVNEKIIYEALQSMEKENFMVWRTSQDEKVHPDARQKISDAFQKRKKILYEEIDKLNSSQFPFFSVLPPWPTELTMDEKAVHDKLVSKNSHHIRKHVHNARSRTSCKLKNSVGTFLGMTSTLTSKATTRKRTGQILKKEKMLVMVKEAIQNKVPLPTFSENECFDTRVSERWKEYIVIARSTGKFDPPILLQFYRHRHIPEIEDISTIATKYHRNPLDFFLSRNCIVKFYSSLDKTISIQKPDKRLDGYIDETIENKDELKRYSPVKIFILRCSSIHSSGRWYKFLLESLGRQLFTPTINLKIPQTEISIKINLNEITFQKLRDLGNQEKNSLKICFLQKGYKIFQHPLLRYFTIAILEKLKSANYDYLIKKWDAENSVLGCALKRYDRLEWIPCDEDSLTTGIFAFCQSHLIQYRPIASCSRETKSIKGECWKEMPPVEGFLIRLTDKYGSARTHFGKYSIATAYFFTCDNLFFSMKSYRANPPLPIDSMIDETSTETEKEEIWKQWKKIPEIYEQQPYPLDAEDHIEWMNCETNQHEYDSRDFYAFHCFHRRIDQILKSDTLIDLTEVKDIYQGARTDCESDKIKYGVYKEASEMFWHKSYEVDDVSQSIINIETSNGLLLKLLASSVTVAEQWVIKLKQMSSYWKSKQREDTERLLKIRRSNAGLLMLNGEEETKIGENTLRWIIEHGRADEQTFNANGISLSRPIIQKGPLYQKPHKHSVFSKYYVVLISGFIVLFHCFHRSTTGFANEVLEYAHYMTIPIDDCYLYSGTTTELDLLQRDRTFDEINYGSHALPRVYGDGWRSVEDESSRCFTLWFGTRRALSSNRSRKKESENSYTKTYDGQCNFVDQLSALEVDIDNPDVPNNTDKIHFTKKLGVSGKSMVFMARSRQERDLWVMSIYYELERLRRAASSSNGQNQAK